MSRGTLAFLLPRPSFDPTAEENDQAHERDGVSDTAIRRPAEIDVDVAISVRYGNYDQSGVIGLFCRGGPPVHDDFPGRVAKETHSEILRCGRVNREMFFRLAPRHDGGLHRNSILVAHP